MTPRTKPSNARSLETNMLAYARSVQITEGVFHGVRDSGGERRRMPIEVLEKGVRGQTSDAKGKNAGQSNPQFVEFAAVPQGCSGMELTFSVRVLPFALKPYACDDPDVARDYQDLAAAYAKCRGFSRLAGLYAWNVANGRFAWRNRWQTDAAEVRIAFEGREVIFNPLHDCFQDLENPVEIESMASATIQGGREDINVFIERFAGALSGQDSPFTFDVVWAAKMDAGQEVFPSQEYVREENAAKNAISRVYAKLPAFYDNKPVQQASMHSQKIGAALRHIDVWHGDSSYGAIAVNPYGGVQETSRVLRDPKSKRSFYDLRRNADALFAMLNGGGEEDAITGDLHFVMANLVRGGVFGNVKED